MIIQENILDFNGQSKSVIHVNFEKWMVGLLTNTVLSRDLNFDRDVQMTSVYKNKISADWWRDYPSYFVISRYSISQ